MGNGTTRMCGPCTSASHSDAQARSIRRCLNHWHGVYLRGASHSDGQGEDPSSPKGFKLVRAEATYGGFGSCKPGLKLLGLA